MANRFAGNVIVIDTTNTQVGGVGGTPVGPLQIREIKWVGTQNSGKNIEQNDDLGIKWGNSTGDYIIECRAQEATPHAQAYAVVFPNAWKCPHGLYIEDLDGGELQIFLA